MKKAIMMSEHPQWLAKILNGEKTVDFRKTKPSCELPIDVYLYCTKNKDTLLHFVEKAVKLNSLVVARFTLNKVQDTGDYRVSMEDVLEKACMDMNTYNRYCTETIVMEREPDIHVRAVRKRPYAWHIDNLVIFDEPMALSEFYLDWDRMDTDSGGRCIGFHDIGINPLTKAPQSWQYVYVKEDGK